jgi:hypothetical protein
MKFEEFCSRIVLEFEPANEPVSARIVSENFSGDSVLGSFSTARPFQVREV